MLRSKDPQIRAVMTGSLAGYAKSRRTQSRLAQERELDKEAAVEQVPVVSSPYVSQLKSYVSMSRPKSSTNTHARGASKRSFVSREQVVYEELKDEWHGGVRNLNNRSALKSRVPALLN